VNKTLIAISVLNILNNSIESHRFHLYSSVHKPNFKSLSAYGKDEKRSVILVNLCCYGATSCCACRLVCHCHSARDTRVTFDFIDHDHDQWAMCRGSIRVAAAAAAGTVYSSCECGALPHVWIIDCALTAKLRFVVKKYYWTWSKKDRSCVLLW